VEANRTRSWKHGLYAKKVKVTEVRRKQIDNLLGEGAGEVIDAYHSAIIDGDMTALSPVTVRGLADTEIVRRAIFGKVAEEGVLITEPMVDADGEFIGERKKDNPLLFHLHKFNEDLGFQSSQQLLTPKSRGENKKDEALAAMLERDRELRKLPAESRSLPLPDED